MRTKTVVIYRNAHSEKQAWLLMCNAIAKEQSVDPGVVCRYFDYEKFRNVRFEFEKQGG